MTDNSENESQRSKRSGIVSLILIGSVAVFFGFKSCYSHDDDDYASPQPSHYSGGHYFWSGSSRSGGSSSGVHSGTSRGGFGASGHAAGS